MQGDIVSNTEKAFQEVGQGLPWSLFTFLVEREGEGGKDALTAYSQLEKMPDVNNKWI